MLKLCRRLEVNLVASNNTGKEHRNRGSCCAKVLLTCEELINVLTLIPISSIYILVLNKNLLRPTQTINVKLTVINLA